MLSQSPKFSHSVRGVRGFSLIELMVALALGLLIIGAVVTVFASNQQSARAKQEMDGAQEAFRFASHTIMRVVQQGVIQAPQSNRDLLVVRVPRGLGHADCLGRILDADIVDAINTFFVDGSRLRCRVLTIRSNAANNATVEETLVEGVDAERSVFTFGVSDAANAGQGQGQSGAGAVRGYWSNNDLWIRAGAVQDWPNVRSVRIRLAMESDGAAIGPTALFSATMRCGALDSC